MDFTNLEFPVHEWTFADNAEQDREGELLLQPLPHSRFLPDLCRPSFLFLLLLNPRKGKHILGVEKGREYETRRERVGIVVQKRREGGGGRVQEKGGRERRDRNKLRNP